MIVAPPGLVSIVEYRHPDSLAISFDRHSDEAWTVTVYDLDYSYYRWLGTLSLDNRWTLSPLDDFTHNAASP